MAVILDEQKSIACIVRMEMKREKRELEQTLETRKQVRKQAKAKHCDYEREKSRRIGSEPDRNVHAITWM